MTEEERRDEEVTAGAEPADPQGESTPGVDQPAGQQAEVEPAPDSPPHEEEPETEPAPDSPPDEEEPEAEPAPDSPPDEEEPEAGAGGGAAEAEQRPASDLPPGAELDPIALEPERELSAEERARLEAEEEERRRREAEAEDGEEPIARRRPQVQLSDETRIQATGKRKSSVARVLVVSGSGEFEVNSRGLAEYFPRHAHQAAVKQPLVTTGYDGSVDVRVRVHGGGVSGQADAVRHGVARALVEIDPELRPELKRRGLLTRDARRKERRKAGLKKARKRPQFSKR